MTLLKILMKALNRVNVDTVSIYDFRGISPLFDYFIIANVNSERQANSALSYIKEETAIHGFDVKHVEGKQGGWTLIDCHDIIVNLFTEEQREYYNLDKLLLDIPRVPLDEFKDI